MQTSDAVETLNQEMVWLESVIERVIRSYLLQEGHENKWQDIPVPDLSQNSCGYASLVNKHTLNVYERVTLALTLAPHIKPDALDVFFGKNQVYDRGFTEFGGVVDKQHSGFLPTGQTL